MGAHHLDQPFLQKEFNLFMKAFFPKAFSHLQSSDNFLALFESYKKANESFWKSFEIDQSFQKQLLTYQKIIQEELDIVAIEHAWRTINPSNPLSIKLQIFHYILESQSSFLHHFVNLEKSTSFPIIALVKEFIRHLSIHVKGKFLIRRIGLGRF